MKWVINKTCPRGVCHKNVRIDQYLIIIYLYYYFPGKRGNGKGLLCGYRVSGGDESVPELDSSEGYTKLSVC